MLLHNIENIPNLSITKYVFEKKNDLLQKHTHPQDISQQHITIILSGVLECVFPTHSKILKQGEIYDFKEDEQTHELIALEDNTIILNIRKNGKNENIEDYTEEELLEQENARIKFEEEQRIFKENQLKLIKELEENDRKAGILDGNTNNKGRI